MKRSLYLFKRASDGAYKIGMSGDVSLRLNTLRSSLKCGIELVCSGPAKFSAGKKEAKIHRNFAEKHMCGEWFALSDCEANGIAEEIAGGVGVFLHEQIAPCASIKLPAEIHARLKHAASEPPAVQITELASRLINEGLDRRDKAKAKKGGKT